MQTEQRPQKQILHKEVKKMLKAYCWLRSWLKSEKGATAVEYGIMVALIAVFIIGAVTLVGQNLDLLFRAVANAL
jgi:pilus assembly protein Flp/PilA